MTVDPRAALDRLVAALEAHFHAVVARQGEDDPAVDDAYDVLADAFEVYDDALGTVHGEATPFYLAEEDDEDDEFEDDEDEDEDEVDVDGVDDVDDEADDDESDDEADDWTDDEADDVEVEPAR
ncbi:primosomal protein [Cellulomonas sp. DKR-3]|uniref:Primosomal protein n=1 Tax=Cellulomonas fulva TaxID=2835530 RepID=A0ABS5U1Q6_9CELL|nr:primosomal protein [Cellulomonas fulva]MBT0995246.1 primosomal protein [Cellulomonas fulva]